MKAIAAMTLDRAIGHDGKLPWPPLKADFHFFKGVTKGKKLVMGSRTYNSLPQPYLKDRTIFSVSRNRVRDYVSEYPNANCKVHHMSYRDEVPNNFPIKGDDVWLCGGAEMYRTFLPLCSDLYLTIVLDDYVGDVFMPEFSGLFGEQRLVKEYRDMWIVHYWNRTSLVSESYRDGFDAKLIGKSVTNPYFAENPTAVGIDCTDNWTKGFNDAPTLL